MTTEGATTRLVVRDLSKSFGGTAALKKASFEAGAGEVHALMGENGAGKSTLLGIIAGLVHADSGEISLDGAKYGARTPAQARRAGVAIVPQEPTLCGHLTVAQNITLGAEVTSMGLVDAAARDRACREAIAPLGVVIEPARLAGTLSPAERQLVCIARALVSQRGKDAVKVLILDEPTSSLTFAEAERVLDAARALASSGVCVLYVSHTLGEVVRVADSFTVLRNGETVRSGPMAGTTVADLTTMLLGHPEPPVSHERAELGEKLLSAKAVKGVRLPDGVSLDLHRGEIVGLFGLVGSGRTELARALFGLDRVAVGEVAVRGVVLTHATPGRHLESGVGMVSEDRKGEGIALAMSVADNLTLSKLDNLGPPGLIARSTQEKTAMRLIERLGVRAPGPWAPASALSGGNQQKLAVGRLLHHDVDVLLLDEPTRGIDIKSREQLYATCRELAAAGKAILWIASQPAELLRVCHRVAVMRRGALGPLRDVAELTETGLLEEAASG